MQTDKKVKINNLIIIVGVLLVVVLCIGLSFAWFSGYDNSGKNFQMGNAVEINMVNAENNELAANALLPMQLPSEYLLPGMEVKMDAIAKFKKSSTPALLRAELKVEVSGGNNLTEEDYITLQSQINDSVQLTIDTTLNTKWAFYNGWWYYLGANNVNETLANSVCESIDCSNGATIKFINNFFQIPKQINSKFAKAKIKFNVCFQAIQAEFYGDSGELLNNTILVAEEKLQEAFN